MFIAFEPKLGHPAVRAQRTLLVGFLVLVALGCRTPRDNQFDILERELRTQEDYIYELEDYVVEYSQKLRQCRCAQSTREVAERLEPEPAPRKPNPADDDRHVEPLRIDDEEVFLEPEDESPAGLQQPEDMVPPPLELEETTPEEFEIPELEISEPLGQVESTATPDLVAPDLDTAVLDINEEIGQTVVEDDQLLMVPDPVAKVQFRSHVEHQQILSAEHHLEIPPTPAEPAARVEIVQLFRSEPGDGPPNTLLAVVEARTAKDQPVEFAGEVSLMVMTGEAGKPQRLKRWDFDPEDAASAWQSSHLGDGLHLELPLGETELPAIPLELWVRIVSPDGRKLLSQLPFQQQQLAALETETGAQELLADEGDSATEEVLVVAENSVETEQAKQPTGWKAASKWADMDSQGQPSQVKKTSGWIAGRVNRTPPNTASRGTQPKWSARR